VGTVILLTLPLFRYGKIEPISVFCSPVCDLLISVSTRHGGPMHFYELGDNRYIVKARVACRSNFSDPTRPTITVTQPVQTRSLCIKVKITNLLMSSICNSIVGWMSTFSLHWHLPPRHLTSWPLLRLLDPIWPVCSCKFSDPTRLDPIRGSGHSPYNSDQDLVTNTTCWEFWDRD